MQKKPPKLYGTGRPTFSEAPKKTQSPGFLKAILNGMHKLFLYLLTKQKKRGSSVFPGSPRQKKTQGISLKRIILRTFITLFIWLFCLGAIGILWFSYDLPDVNRLQISVRKPSITIQAKDGSLISTYGDLYEEVVKIHELPPYVPQAFMAIEDRRFFTHFGLDFIGLGRALYTNYKANRVVQGGSTLTQQLAKNFLFTQGMYQVNDRSLRRKVQEAIMALWLEWTFTKEQIFTMYLNRVYFGAGTYGIEAASRKYFDKSARQLTVYEAAVIAGLLKAPSRYSPTNSPQKSHERARVVLQQMVDAGYIKSAELYLTQQGQKDLLNLQGGRFFADWIYEAIPGLIGSYDQDLVILTTFDPQVQKHAEEATKSTMERMAKDLRTTEISLVAMTPDGAVRAMIGGTHYNKSQYNRATQALRQPGSSFKPFIYLAGLEKGFTPETIFSDAPITVGKWSPKNFRTYRSVGELTMLQALTRSVNTVTVRIALEVGAKKIADTARRLGITADMIDDMSISLGTTEVTLLELVSAYATFAHKGKSVWAYGIVEIRNRHGDILYQREGNTENQVIDPKYVRQMNQMLMNVVSHGTGRRAQLKCPPSVKGDVLPQVAGKTGSNGDYDAWFIGFTPDLVAGIWTGNDHNTPMHKNSTGSRLPAETFSAFMSPLSCSLSSKESLISRDEEAMTLEAEEESKEVLNIDETKDDPTGENKGENKDDFEDLLTQAAQE